MENSESSSRKRSRLDINSSADPDDPSSPSKRARVECRTTGSILENRPVSTPEVMAGSKEHYHEEPELDLTLRLGMPGTRRNQRVQFQAPAAVEDKIVKLEAVAAELARAEEENRLAKEKLSAATAENAALRDRLSKLLLERKATTEKGEDEQGGAIVLYPLRPDQTPSDHEDRPSSSSNPDQADQPSMRKPQVLIRIRTEQPMTDDGCRWKKYGQKTLGSAFPRAYYRCSLQKGCSVSKKVQRCAEDPTVLITKYEGSHNHLLPASAVATANGTSEAMSMLLSGSLCSTNSVSTSNNSFFAGATISAIDPFPAVMVDYTRPPPAAAVAIDRTSELTRAIFSNPEFNAALVAAVAASSRVLGCDDGDGQEDGKKDGSK